MDTAPRAVPVYRALKNPTSAQAVPNECNRGSTTVFSTTAPVELTPPANRDVEHHVHVQLGSLYDLLNSLIMGIRRCATTGM